MTAMLTDGDSFYGADTATSGAQACVLGFWRHRPGQAPAHRIGELKGELPTETASSPTAAAVVNHGRWTVHCPFPGCASAQYASRRDRRFFCVDCSNGGTGTWVWVVWPDDAAGIEAALEARPVAATRNWTPPETVDDLRAENAAGGLT